MSKVLRAVAGMALSTALAAGGVAVSAPATAASAGCVQPVSYYRTHDGSVWVDPNRSPLPARRPLTYMVVMMGLTWEEILETARGDAQLMAAQQMIAAAMNLTANPDGWRPQMTAEYAALSTYFETGGRRPLTRGQLLRITHVLRAYNNGLLGIPRC